MEERGKWRKQVKERERKKEQREGSLRQVIWPALQSLSSKTEKRTVQEEPHKPFAALKVFKSCTAGLVYRVWSGWASQALFSRSSCPPTLPFSEGDFIWRSSRKARDRHLGFGFCLLGGRGELAGPTVYLHRSFLTPPCPSACSCSSSGGGKKVEKWARGLQCLWRRGSLSILGTQQGGDRDGAGQSSNRSWRSDWFACSFKTLQNSEEIN